MSFSFTSPNTRRYYSWFLQDPTIYSSRTHIVPERYQLDTEWCWCVSALQFTGAHKVAGSKRMSCPSGKPEELKAFAARVVKATERPSEGDIDSSSLFCAPVPTPDSVIFWNRHYLSQILMLWPFPECKHMLKNLFFWHKNELVIIIMASGV